MIGSKAVNVFMSLAIVAKRLYTRVVSDNLQF